MNNLIIYNGDLIVLELLVDQTEPSGEHMSAHLDDNSYRDCVIMGDHTLKLSFSSPEFIEVPVGAYCVFKGIKYTLERPENLTKKGSRIYEYSLTLDAPQAKLKSFIFRNTVPGDRRLKFSLTARPHEHLQMLVDNLNERDSGWSIGECIDAFEKVISYNHTSCSEALSLIANEFGTEWEINDKVISLRKVEYFKDNPLPLSYGIGNGFVPGLGRTNFDNSMPIQRLFVQGGERNIDRSKYGSSELHMPPDAEIAYDGTYFEDEEEFDASLARHYKVDSDGFSIVRTDKEMDIAEASLDLSDIYPSREGEVTGVEVVDEDGNLYDFFDSTIPENLDFSKYRIDGEVITLIFQSGMLAGRELEITQNENRVTGYVHSERRFKLVPQEIDGITMPNAIYKPAIGDRYALFGIMLPDEYIADNATKSGTSWDMFREAVKHKYENEDPRFTFTSELDGLWAKRDWENIGGRLIIGGYVLFSDSKFLPEGVAIRIAGIKDYINKPHSPKIDLSNVTAGGGFRSTIERIGQNEVVVDDRHKDAISFTKRRFRDARETMDMLSNSLLNFSEGVNPVWVNTMQLLVGDESLQFRFVNSKTDPVAVIHGIKFDPVSKQFTADAGILQHMTLDITDISSTHEYRFWDIPAYVSDHLTDPQSYYFYAKVSRTGTTGEFRLEREAIEMHSDPDYYYLLVGFLNSERDGDRSFAQMYGFTEILPGQIVTDMIRSGDGRTYFDLAGNEIGGRINFADGLVSGDIGIGNEHGINAGMSGVGSGANGENNSTDVRIYAGAAQENKESAPFRVLHDGSLVATNANISGVITANSGRIGAITIDNSGLVGTDTSRITMRQWNVPNNFIMLGGAPWPDSTGWHVPAYAQAISTYAETINFQDNFALWLKATKTGAPLPDPNSTAVALMLERGHIRGLAFQTVRVTASFTIKANDTLNTSTYYTCYNTSNMTITLPNPATEDPGRIFYFRRMNSSTVTLSGTLYQAGAVTSVGIPGQGDLAMVVNDGRYWCFNFMGRA